MKAFILKIEKRRLKSVKCLSERLNVPATNTEKS